MLLGWQALTDCLHAVMARRVTEEIRVVFLNNRNVMIRDEPMGQGAIDQAPVRRRKIVKRALEPAASAVGLVHNHPSGDPQPSRDDIVMTKAVIEAGRHLGLAVHDHVIIGRGGHVSMKAWGLIWPERHLEESANLVILTLLAKFQGAVLTKERPNGAGMFTRSCKLHRLPQIP